MKLTACLMRIMLLFILFLLGIKVQAQILDDSTKMVYGPETTQFTTFDQIKYDLNNYFPLDTTIDNLHKFGAVDESNNLLHNLGFLGSATNPVFFTPPDLIGRTSGFPVYDVFFKRQDEFKYYDTKSPYSNVQIIFAGSNRTIVDVNYTRNVNPNWNVGFNFRRISAERQLDRLIRENRQTMSTYYDIYTHFQTKNKRYSALFNAGRLNHEVVELGGIDTAAISTSIFDDRAFFFYQDANVFLQDAKTREFRFNVNLFHQYQLLSKNIQIYHQLTVNNEKNSFVATISDEERDFFENYLIDEDSTNDQFKFNEFTNEAGLKGEISNLFYIFFAKRRSIDFNQNQLNRDFRNYENSIGGRLRWRFDSLHYLQVNGELMVGGEHLLHGSYRNKFFEASYKRIMSRPAYIHERYKGNHFDWQNSFSSPQSDNIYAAVNYEWKRLKVKPFIRISSIYNHIFFNLEAKPTQTNGFAQIFSPGISFVWEPFDNFYWENTAMFTQLTGSSRDIFRIPELFVNSDFYFKNHLFNSKMYLKLGLGAHYTSPYLALAYQPAIQNFYLQNDFYVPKIDEDRQYVHINAYANVQIGLIRFFFRMEHLNQSQQDGYFTTPYFTAQPRTLNFGINWMFFD